MLEVLRFGDAAMSLVSDDPMIPPIQNPPPTDQGTHLLSGNKRIPEEISADPLPIGATRPDPFKVPFPSQLAQLAAEWRTGTCSQWRMPEMYLYKLARTAPAWQEPGNGLSPPLATANSLGLIIPK
jgi:hypothetical protein